MATSTSTKADASNRPSPKQADGGEALQGPILRRLGYRDDMEAARLRVDALERELETLVPRGGGIPIEVQIVELRRRAANAENALERGRQERERGELAVQELAVARDRIRSLEEALEMVQGELQRRRREHEDLFRKAALAEVRVREAEMLRDQLAEATTNQERETRRADVAIVTLIRTQMRLSVEHARPRIEDPWPQDAVRDRADELRSLYCPEALESLERESARRALTRLAFLIADLIWNPPAPTEADLAELLSLLRDAGHPLIEHDNVRLGPLPPEDPGLSIAMAPLALQVVWADQNCCESVVTIADDDPLRYEFFC